ncbi:LysR family transcriptional regulator [Paraburkholderia heleia]|uniref:LysR family transcriptional regulator n=1 Tax=Paraburkholderia heleia TaxID=634127 RepID=UPI003CD0A1B1
MELCNLRYFIAVAEELRFAPAAERLHIEPPRLPRALRKLDENLALRICLRPTCSTRLPRAGNLFMEQVPRGYTASLQVHDSARVEANGFHRQLRVVISYDSPPLRFFPVV